MRVGLSDFMRPKRSFWTYSSLKNTLATLPRRKTVPQISGRRHFTVLGLESSADDSCAAVVTDTREIRSNVVIRQDDEHRQYGGIHPYVAIMSHQRNMPLAVQRALLEANCTMEDIDGIAFTRGPGMPGCLSVAAATAKGIAAALWKPLVGVHHMHAHALTPLLTQPDDELPKFPFLTLLLTGGHTLLLLAKEPLTFEVLADTVDSSIGTAFDIASRTLSLPPHPKGLGAALEAFCAQPVADAEVGVTIEPFKSPMRHAMAFSFSGILAQVTIPVQRLGQKPDAPTKLAFARAFQDAAARHLEEKLLMALSSCKASGLNIKHLVVSGGVASNLFLRQRLQECLSTFSLDHESPVRLICPPPALCTDNAAMIAWASMDRFLHQDHDDFTVSLRPTWRIENLTQDASVDTPWHERRNRATRGSAVTKEDLAS